LDGVSVLDLTQGVAGPYCTKLLAGLGADVIKVEPANEGDASRRLGPFVGDDSHPEKSIPFLYLNTAKRSVTLNHEAPEATGLVRDLAGTVDLVIEDLSAAERDRLQVSYEHLRDEHPGLVVCSVTHFGLAGPYREYLGEEIVDQALSGHMAITGEPDREPLRMGGDVAQYVAGQTAFVGAMMALYHATVTGEGQHVDGSSIEASADILDGEGIHTLTGRPRQRIGNFTEASFLRGRGGLYETSDGWIALGQTPGGWDEFAEMIDDDRLRAPELSDPAGRVARKSEIEPVVQQWLRERSKVEVYEESQGRRNVSGFVATPEDVLSSTHLSERGFFVELDHPVAGPARYAGAPFRFASSDWRSARAPLLGEHNRQVYVERLGMAPSAFERLRESGAV
jgi:crotonobetainyl-CoA:carnitine CoA-transferase CaiB-like acyl-CoA transferase